MAVAASLAASEASSYPQFCTYDYLCHSKLPSSLSLRSSQQQSRYPRLSLRSHNGAVIVLASSSTSASPNSFDDLASRLVDAARSAWLETVKFVQCRELQTKIHNGFSFANQKIEEFGYDAVRGAENLNRRFRLLERAREMVDLAIQKVKNVDRELGLVQKFRNASTDFGRNWPMYARQLNLFLRTPIGRISMTLAFLWFLLSGWFFRIMIFSMWVLPLAAPLLINSAARSMIVEGSCPACKRRFIGNRTQMIMCNYCKAVVWQPRQDYSKDKTDPSIIDVDIE